MAAVSEFCLHRSQISNRLMQNWSSSLFEQIEHFYFTFCLLWLLRYRPPWFNRCYMDTFSFAVDWSSVNFNYPVDTVNNGMHRVVDLLLRERLPCYLTTIDSWTLSKLHRKYAFFTVISSHLRHSILQTQKILYFSYSLTLFSKVCAAFQMLKFWICMVIRRNIIPPAFLQRPTCGGSTHSLHESLVIRFVYSPLSRPCVVPVTNESPIQQPLGDLDPTTGKSFEVNRKYRIGIKKYNRALQLS